jgi:hypothetical protein
VGILRRLILLIRYFLPDVRIRVRLDGEWHTPRALSSSRVLSAKISGLCAFTNNPG